MSRLGEWEPEAQNWLRWARAPRHDAYWYYRDSFFDRLIPPPGLRTLEIGCGEGRVTRDLAARGHRVVGVDTAPTLLGEARAMDTRSSYILGDGSRLAFCEECFDLVVAYNSLQVVADMKGAVREAGRVLRHGGRFCICVTHPAFDMGKFVDESSGDAFALRPRYFDTERVEDTVESGGLTMTFRGWTYSIESYALALEEAGLHIEAIREPKPTDPSARYERWLRIPMFMLLRAVKV
jgi:ubiquinone/menaquinone biosynthesis C-methylase UbiE